ncbi:hypothetical protein [Streptomyces sp. NPDC059209]|uniref:hypothetical protein n=1 Tax=Streptomyces sp. NPDC059209 TaxID=3346769 RepID=UPI0036A1A31A
MLNATNKKHPVSVLPDELTGGRSAIKLLADAGHREGIALIGHNEEAERGLFRSTTVAQRITGIRAEMAARGMRFAAEESCWSLTTVGLPHEAMGRASVEILLAPRRPSAGRLIPMPVIERRSVRSPAE